VALFPRIGTTLQSPFGNASRNPGRTPAFYKTDLAVNKKFSTPVESLKVEFCSEFYRVFNHTNLYLPSSGLGGTLGGNPTSGGVISSNFTLRKVSCRHWATGFIFCTAAWCT